MQLPVIDHEDISGFKSIPLFPNLILSSPGNADKYNIKGLSSL